jgi:flagellar protein FliO/FliZ
LYPDFTNRPDQKSNGLNPDDSANPNTTKSFCFFVKISLVTDCIVLDMNMRILGLKRQLWTTALLAIFLLLFATKPCSAIPLPDSTSHASQPVTIDDNIATNMAGSTIRVLGASFVVFAAIFTLAYAFRKLGFRRDRVTSHVPIRVIGARGLGPKKGIYVVETLGRILVIGMTEQNITLLAEMHDLSSLEGADISFDRAGGSPFKFADFLNDWLVKLPGKMARNGNHKS